MSALKGKVAVVTGGSSGIGLAIARRFVDEGAYVFIVGRRATELDKAVAEIGKNIAAFRADISTPAEIDRLYSEVTSKKGKIDIVVANAGIVELVPTADASPEHLRLSTPMRKARTSPCRRLCQS